MIAAQQAWLRHFWGQAAKVRSARRLSSPQEKVPTHRSGEQRLTGSKPDASGPIRPYHAVPFSAARRAASPRQGEGGAVGAHVPGLGRRPGPRRCAASSSRTRPAACALWLSRPSLLGASDPARAPRAADHAWDADGVTAPAVVTTLADALEAERALREAADVRLETEVAAAMAARRRPTVVRPSRTPARAPFPPRRWPAKVFVFRRRSPRKTCLPPQYTKCRSSRRRPGR